MLYTIIHKKKKNQSIRFVSLLSTNSYAPVAVLSTYKKILIQIYGILYYNFDGKYYISIECNDHNNICVYITRLSSLKCGIFQVRSHYRYVKLQWSFKICSQNQYLSPRYRLNNESVGLGALIYHPHL